MARRYVRDAKGRFASKGYSGQTGGRGARLKSAGKTRAGGGSRIDKGTGKPAGTISGTKRGRSSDAAERMIKRDTASNKVAPSPRQLTKNEKIARDVMADKRFRSDRQRIAEMQRRGVSPNTDFVGLASDAKRKGGGTAGGARISYVNNKPKPAAKRADRAASNIPMSGSRGRRLNAEISRNVKQQAATKRAESKVRNRQFKSDQSRAKALRERYGDQLARDFAAKSGRKVSEVRATIKGMAPSQQVKLLTQAGRQQRAQTNLARTADTRNKPGSTMIRRPSAKQSKSNRRAQTAVDIYSASGSKRSQIIRNQNRLARTERAQNNQMRTREARLAEANATGLPMIKVTKPKRRKLK